MLGKIASSQSKLPTAACWSREEKRGRWDTNPSTDDNMRLLANDINQAFLCPQQALLPIRDDYHVSTSGYEAPTISFEQCFKWLNAVVYLPTFSEM